MLAGWRAASEKKLSQLYNSTRPSIGYVGSRTPKKLTPEKALPFVLVCAPLRKIGASFSRPFIFEKALLLPFFLDEFFRAVPS